jgi:hypothetical protein
MNLQDVEIQGLVANIRMDCPRQSEDFARKL